ncbi:MAG: MFS transporter [Candidatus Thorarchaeota archaeon]|jgi:MFS family permease
MTDQDGLLLENEPVQTQETESAYRRVLGRNDFTRLWSGQLVSNAGTSISYLALLFFAFDISGTATAMAVLAMVEVFPLIAFSGLIGVYVDRWDRKKIMVGTDFVRAALILLFPFVTILPSYLPPIVWLYILAFIYSTVNAFFYPARSAAIPSLVETRDLVTANSLSTMTFQIISLVVTPLGGVLVALLRPDYFLAFFIDAMTFILSAAFLWGIKTSLVPEKRDDHEVSFVDEIIEGARIIRTSGLMSFIIGMFTVLSLGSGMVNALVIPFFEGELGFGSIQFSLLLSGGAVSGLLSAIYLGNKSQLSKPLFIITAGMIWAGIVILGMSLISDFFGALLLFSSIGLVNVLIGVPANALIQEFIERDKLGRVFSFENIMINIALVMGMGVGGVWADAVGSSRPPFFLGGLVIALVGIVGAILVVRLRLHSQIDKIRSEREAEMIEATQQQRETVMEDLQEIADSTDADPPES